MVLWGGEALNISNILICNNYRFFHRKILKQQDNINSGFSAPSLIIIMLFNKKNNKQKTFLFDTVSIKILKNRKNFTPIRVGF